MDTEKQVLVSELEPGDVIAKGGSYWTIGSIEEAGMCRRLRDTRGVIIREPSRYDTVYILLNK